MFSRIFNLPKKEEKKELPCEWHVSLDDFQAAPRLPKLSKSNIRVLVFKDCDRKGKSLVFDSDAVVEVKEDEKLSPKLARNLQSAPNPHSPCSSSRSLPAKYKFLKPKADIKMLGEMVFGSVTMAYRGSLVKVHHIRTPPQVLLSKVFAIRSRSSAQAVCSSDGNQSGIFNQPNAMMSEGRSFTSESIAIPVMSSSPNRSLPGSVYVPGMSTPSLCSRSNLSLTSNLSIDSLNRSGSISSLFSPSPSPGCSLNRRWHRSQMTRLENYQHSKLKLENSDEMQTVYRRQPKIGICVIFKLWESKEEKNRVFQSFLFSHYSLFEGHVQRLKSAIEKSFHSKKNFFVAIIEAVENFKQDILSFYSAPRLLEPVWLNMMNIREKQEEIAERFISTLMRAMDMFEKKEQSYFLSSLLTAVLTHHLAWVPTVMPGGSAPNRAYLDKHASITLDVLARCHPYNPLWAQLGDLYGTVGYPPKITKTIVVGKDPTLVRQVLYILSYFIRCSEIKEFSLKMLPDFENEDFSIGNSDQLSSFTETPTNTPDPDHWRDDTVSKESCKRVGLNEEQETEGKLNGDVVEENGKAFDDHEEICNCMCSVLQSIDYIGTKGLRNIKKLSNAIKTESKKHVDFQNVKNAKLENCDNHNNAKKSGTDSVAIRTNLQGYVQSPTFKCYCCPEKQHNFKSFVETSDKVLPRQNSAESSEHSINGEDSKSCVCGDRETSEYGSETRSNQCTLSRNSSCASCLDVFRKYEIRSQDSDYSSIANEDHGVDNIGIVLDLHDLDGVDEKSEKGDEDDLSSMNLLELPLPESEIKALPRRSFDHKAELPNFGRSLLAGYCEKFIGDFALHGVRSIDMKAIERELQLSVRYSVLDETISDAAYIIADIDKRTCQLVSLSKNREFFTGLGSEKITKTELFGSTVVSELLESLKGLWHLNIPFQFCLMHLEDRLKDIYSKSKVLAELVRTNPEAITKDDIKKKMRLGESDLDLIIATGSTHCQYLQQGGID